MSTVLEMRERTRTTRVLNEAVTSEHHTTETPSAGALLLRIREVATLLAVSERQVWVLIRAGQLRAIHPRGMRAVRVARADVEALVASWRRESAAG